MVRRPSREPHEVLGVGRGASRSEIARAFRDRARLLHPDVSGSDTTAEMADLSAARDVLLPHADDGPATTRRATPRERPDWANAHEAAWTDHWAAWNEPRPPDE
jgi:DnaJ domain